MDIQSTSVPSTANDGHHSGGDFKRDMGFWGDLALGFTYLSPVVGVYATFAASMALAGPPAFWMLIIAGAGQLLVATVFGEVVSQYQIAGGIYPWNKHLWGKKWGWMSGWIYMIAINVTIASVAYGAGPFLGALLGIEMSPIANVLLALLIIFLATIANLCGTKFLANVAFVGFVVEIIASAAIGVWLLLTVRKHDTSPCCSRTSARATCRIRPRSSSPSSARRLWESTSTTASKPTATSPRRSAIPVGSFPKP